MREKLFNRHGILSQTIVALTIIVLAAVLRIVPHPWNFTPIGAMALFAGALVRDRRIAFSFPLLTLVVSDIFIGFNILEPLVYGSFLVNVLIGLWLRCRRTPVRIGTATFLGAIQFFLVTNFGVWMFLSTYPKTAAGLLTCYAAGVPLFWNTLAGDALFATLLFGGYALAERAFPALRQHQLDSAR
ncbi:MAG TPA: DUF6580 family putative transport protein [Candidatus Methylomirabilis sp.]|nr:DUF6580 family putative transport protein [Candidatus Methylomirabilis sp.]